jgi:hypothetical protein
MAYIVGRKSGKWEIRESRATPRGPRSRTLATFSTLIPEVIERARARAAKPVDADELRRIALRAGAPVAQPAPDRAAGELIAELASGRQLRPVLRRLLLGALHANGDSPNDAVLQATAPWIAATPRQRGEALRDLLLLADRLPPPRTRSRARFPRVESAPA